VGARIALNFSPPRFRALDSVLYKDRYFSRALVVREFFMEGGVLMPAGYKIEKVAELKKSFSECKAVFIGEYRGLSVQQMTDIRASVREAGGEMKVAKNRLALIALNEEGYTVPDGLSNGPNVYTLAYEDPVAVAKALKEFSKVKANKAFVLKGGFLGTKAITADEIQALADLPSRDELIAQVVGTIAAPLRGLVTVLSGTPRGLVTCLSKIRDNKEDAA